MVKKLFDKAVLKYRSDHDENRLSFVLRRQRRAPAKKIMPRILKLDKAGANFPERKNTELRIPSPATAIIETTTGRSVPRISCMILHCGIGYKFLQVE